MGFHRDFMGFNRILMIFHRDVNGMSLGFWWDVIGILIVKLVSPITLGSMEDITIVNGFYKPTYNTRTPPCKVSGRLQPPREKHWEDLGSSSIVSDKYYKLIYISTLLFYVFFSPGGHYIFILIYIYSIYIEIDRYWITLGDGVKQGW